MLRPLLVIDGNSFAHRSYHALPKTIRRRGNKGGGAILGFANFLLRLYENEKPRAVLVAWDSLDEATYRHEALPAYQSGREFDDELVDQLEVLPISLRPVVSPMPRPLDTRPTISWLRRLPRRNGARELPLWPPAIGMPFSSHPRGPPFFSR